MPIEGYNCTVIYCQNRYKTHKNAKFTNGKPFIFSFRDREDSHCCTFLQKPFRDWPPLSIISQRFTALILFRGTKINADLPLKTGFLRARNFCSHSTSKQITLRNQNKRKTSYRKVEEEALRIKRHVCFFILQNIKYVFIYPSRCTDYSVPASRRTYVVLLTVCFFGCWWELVVTVRHVLARAVTWCGYYEYKSIIIQFANTFLCLSSTITVSKLNVLSLMSE